MDEEQLINGCVNGNREAQKALYEKYSRKMMAVCLRYVKNTEDARDVMQEGFVKLFSNLPKYKSSGSFDSWVYKIFANSALEFIRRNHLLSYTDDFDDYDDIDEPDEASVWDVPPEVVMDSIRSLPDGFRTIFNMYAVDGYSHKEIAEKLKITESTSRSQYMRARKMLQKMILDYTNR